MAKGATKKLWYRAIVVLFVFIFLGFGAALFNLFTTIFVRGEDLVAEAQSQQLQDILTKPRRGNIYDRNGKVLATSATVWQVYISPTNIDEEKRADVAENLAQLLDLDLERVQEYVNSEVSYQNVGRPVDQTTAQLVREYIRANRGLGSVIGLTETSQRYYPNDELAANVLGFVGVDNQGLYGIELQYDKKLSGTPGRVVAAKNPAGAELPFSYEMVIDAKEGYSIVLTIDEFIQSVVEKHLAANVEENNVENRAAAIVMDVRTGAILAMATKPSFNPNEPFTLTLQDEFDQKIEELNVGEDGPLSEEEVTELRGAALHEQWRNKAVSDIYEPGSVFKIITAAAAMEERRMRDSDTFGCPGFIEIADRRYRCANRDGHGHQSAAQAFANSCNPAIITVGQRLGADDFVRYRRAFGFEEPTGIDMPGEGTSLFHQRRDMGVVELASESFGQTLKISPIQLITAISATVNGGFLYQPHMVKQVLDSDGNVVSNTEPTRVRQVISEETSLAMRYYLEGVVRQGTGRNSYIPGLRIGGKTGTSEKLDIYVEGEEMKYICSFTAIAPAHDPRIAILMLVDEPNVPNAFGGTIVAPTVGNMFREILPYLGVAPSYTEEEAADLALTTPNFVGSTLSNAQSHIEYMGLRYKVIGGGEEVLSQTPPPAASIPSGGTVVLYTKEAADKDKVRVPDFRGLTISQANERAISAGLNMQISGNTMRSTAYSQSIAAGEEVDRGTVITISFREIVVDD